MLATATAFVVLLPLCMQANARSQNFSVAGTCGTDTCGAYASIMVGNGTLTIILSDTVADPGSYADELNGIQLTAPSSAISASTSLTSQSGSLIDINSNGSTTTVSGNPGHWAAAATAASTITLTTAGSPASGQPIDMIIGPPASNGKYSSSLSNSHNPFITGSGTFVLADPLMTSATSITSLTFRFGTSSETLLAGSFVPEPASLALLATSLAGLAIPLTRRRRKKRD